MKHLIYAFLLVISSNAFSQSRQSIEIPDEPRFVVPERQEEEFEEEKDDEKEREAQARQEKQRLLDEERARSNDLDR